MIVECDDGDFDFFDIVIDWGVWHQVPQNLTVLKSQTHGLSTVPDRLL